MLPLCTPARLTTVCAGYGIELPRLQDCEVLAPGVCGRQAVHALPLSDNTRPRTHRRRIITPTPRCTDPRDKLVVAQPLKMFSVFMDTTVALWCQHDQATETPVARHCNASTTLAPFFVDDPLWYPSIYS
jgi:hypothetical protein